jgi:hypothetical protein
MSRSILLTLVAGLMWISLGAETPSAPRAHQTNPPLFVSTQQHAYYLAMVPDGVLTEEEKGRMIFYDRRTVPQAYQHEGCWHAISFNISAAKPGELFGIANREFPWITGGMDESDNGSDFKALILPKRSDGTAEPIRVGTRQLLRTSTRGSFGDGSAYDGFTWSVGRYPVGTKVLEFLVMNVDRVFEVRVLEKVANGDVFEVSNNWKPRWYRAVRDSKELLELTADDSYHAKLTAHYSGKLPSVHLADRNHDQPVFNVETIMDELPPMTPELLAKIYSRPFQEVTDIPWHTEGRSCFAPSGGFVVNKYRGSHFASTECITCHSTVMKHASDFQLFRDWYGRVRGTDGIFSFPMCDESCVAHNGINVRPVWNQKLIAAKLLVSE